MIRELNLTDRAGAILALAVKSTDRGRAVIVTVETEAGVASFKVLPDDVTGVGSFFTEAASKKRAKK